MPAWTLDKSSDPPSGFVVGPGSVVTYTLTATNTSNAIVSGATAVDDLTDVLAHASLLPPLPGSVSQSGAVLTWSIPDLGPGESASVSYSVKVHEDSPQADIRNVVVATGSGGECGVCETSHVIVPGLPATGAIRAARARDDGRADGARRDRPVGDPSPPRGRAHGLTSTTEDRALSSERATAARRACETAEQTVPRHARVCDTPG